jgi:hypothetical protein
MQKEEARGRGIIAGMERMKTSFRIRASNRSVNSPLLNENGCFTRVNLVYFIYISIIFLCYVNTFIES